MDAKTLAGRVCIPVLPPQPTNLSAPAVGSFQAAIVVAQGESAHLPGVML